MKKVFIIAFLLIFVLMLPLVADTWISNAVESKVSGDGMTLTFACSVDSVDTLTSNVFDLSNYNEDSWSTYPINYQLYNTSTLGKPRLTAYIYGTMDNSNWFVADTLFSTDSLETVRYKTADFNNKKAVLYKMIIYGTTGNRSDTGLNLIMYFYRKD